MPRQPKARVKDICEPREIISRDGFLIAASGTFSVTDPNSNHHVRFSFTELPASEEIIASAYRVTCRYLMTKSLSYAYNSLGIFRDMLNADCMAEGRPVQAITLRTIENWRQAHQIRGTRFDLAMSFVVPWLRRWVEWQENGVDEELSIYLEDRVGAIEGDTYVALRTNDPERGALTQREMRDLTAEMNEQLAAGKMSLAEYALMWLLIGTGMRPVQIARMRVGDLLGAENRDSTEIDLLIPSAKGEGAYEGQWWRQRAPSVVAEVLRSYLGEYNLSDRTGPLFPSRKDGSKPASAETIKSLVSRIGARLNVFTSRLDGPIPLFAYRFRYTVGTRAVELGANDHVVARLLTHRSTWSAKSYRAATPGGQKAVIAALGDELETIARAFRGKIVTDLSDATRSGEAQALIRDFERLSGRSMGACGTRAECMQLAPIACLTCRHFEAFEDAPFDELREKLLEEQHEEAEIKIRQIYDEPVAALDELICAQDAVRVTKNEVRG